MKSCIKFIVLALNAATYTTASPVQTTSSSTTTITKRDTTCFDCGEGLDRITMNGLVSKYCKNHASGNPSFQYIYDDIFYVTNGRIAQVSFGVRATGASGCPEDIDMSPEECTRGFRQIADGCNENENVKQGGVYHETCVEWDINPNLKGIGESSCGGDTIWPILGDH